jgi:hypothetical protein
MSREAMKLALEALAYTTTVANFFLGNEKDIGPMLKAREAITALREALAEQPAQRTWVGLTIDEVESGAGLEKAQSTVALDLSTSFWAGARWAEAKLKEKNT